MSKAQSYADAGVDIEAASNALKDAKAAIESTHNKNVLTSIGGFASLFDLSMIQQDYKHPVLVQSIDGVGTKSQICAQTGNYETIGQDIVSATCNDIIVMGAKPLTLLDYVATDSIEPKFITTIINSVAAACKACNVALVGGETAEMPDIYHAKEHDIVGVVTGIIEKDNIISGPEQIKQGDVIIGIESNGLHTNGYSLARHVLLKQRGLALSETLEGFSHDLGTELLRPHINYTMPIMHALENGCNIHGMAHITGGGLVENLPRVLPKDCNAHIDLSSWQPLPIFNLIQKLGNVETLEMHRTFNMGIGYVCICDASEVNKLTASLDQYNLKYFNIGQITAGKQKVSFS
jgi:phosphoribosylformylglycinamidine cyclo-ligase